MNKLKITYSRVLLFYVIFFSFLSIAYAGQTGKISGVIKDQDTGEPVIGANIIVMGTYFGAATDIDGYYYINNISPGNYSVSATSVGYRKTVVEQVIVKIDQTTNLDVSLHPESFELEGEIVVVAEKPLITKDLTSTKATVSSSDIELMPVDNINRVINLQAGVIDGHFRGGRSNEVSYLIDGIPVTDVFSGSNSVTVENSSVRELEVISGTFNAEYGQALSGVVNIVTKEGSTKYEGFASAYFGSYYSNHSNIFQNLNKFSTDGIEDFQFNLSGPTQVLSGLNFFVTGRFLNDDGYYYGKRVYNIYDANPYLPSGDGEWVLMNTSKKYSFNGKLTYSLPNVKLSPCMCRSWMKPGV